MNKKHLLALAVCGALLSSMAAFAGDTVPAPEPQGVVSLNSSATVQVPNDWMTVQFSLTRDGPDAAGVQSALKEGLGAALALARQVAKPDGHVEVQGGGFSLRPRFNTKGAITAWAGSTQMLVQGRDMATIAELAGRVTSMTVGSLSYSVSREAREKVEGEVAAQAIARFRAKAGDYAQAFGYRAYVIRDVNVQTEVGSHNQPRVFAMKLASAPSADEAMPVEAGSGAVTVTVNGSVQLK